MAGEGKFEAAAHADAVDRDRDRFPAGLQPAIDEVQPLRLLDQGAHRRLLAFGLGPALKFGAGGLQEGEVSAADTLCKGNDRALDRSVARDPADDLAELGHDFGVDDIHRAAGHVPGHERYAVGVRLEAKVVEVHGKTPSQAIRRVR